ncbi:hypothetical protein [Deinococcus piscis]|uniref:hypothetical protein n=1 Tax=Deinococcus piscis TaxID=394230 RepID=UPI0016736B3F|nr:hypothetical protein [Deinococcus piscis]
MDGEQVLLSSSPAQSADGPDSESEPGLTAGMPGQAAQAVDDLLAWPLKQSSLALVRYGNWLASTTIPYGAHPSR